MKIESITVVTNEGVANFCVATGKISRIEKESYIVCGDIFPCFRYYDKDNNILGEIRCIHQCEIRYFPQHPPTQGEKK